MTRDRIRKGSVSLIAILLIVILMAFPTGYEDAAIYKGTDRVRAKVLSTDESSVINNGSDPVRRAVLQGEDPRRKV